MIECLDIDKINLERYIIIFGMPIPYIDADFVFTQDSFIRIPDVMKVLVKNDLKDVVGSCKNHKVDKTGVKSEIKLYLPKIIKNDIKNSLSFKVIEYIQGPMKIKVIKEAKIHNLNIYLL